MKVELTEAIQLITRAQSIIEAEARMAEGYDRLYLEDVDDKLSDAIQTLEDICPFPRRSFDHRRGFSSKCGVRLLLMYRL